MTDPELSPVAPAGGWDLRLTFFGDDGVERRVSLFTKNAVELEGMAREMRVAILQTMAAGQSADLDGIAVQLDRLRVMVDNQRQTGDTPGA